VRYGPSGGEHLVRVRVRGRARGSAGARVRVMLRDRGRGRVRVGARVSGGEPRLGYTYYGYTYYGYTYYGYTYSGYICEHHLGVWQCGRIAYTYYGYTYYLLLTTYYLLPSGRLAVWPCCLGPPRRSAG